MSNTNWGVTPSPISPLGHLHMECGACTEVIYDGRWIPDNDLDSLLTAHRLGCSSNAL